MTADERKAVAQEKVALLNKLAEVMIDELRPSQEQLDNIWARVGGDVIPVAREAGLDFDFNREW